MPSGLPLKRWYELTFETLTPLHISLGPEELLIPDEECDTDGDRTYVLDRPALIGLFQERPPALAAAAPAPPAAGRPRTYRDVLLNRNHPDYDRILREYRLSSKLGLVTPDTPLVEAEETAPAPAAPAAELALTRPREVAPADRLWRTPAGRHLVRYELAGTPALPGRDGWWASVSRLPRTPDGRILIAGSAVKGALRSLLAYAMAEQIGVDRLPPPRSEKPRDKFAAQPLEQATLAPNAPRDKNGRPRNVPNHDAGRLLLVRDTALDGEVRARITPFGVLGARGFRTFSGGGTPEAFGAVEAAPPGITFRTRLAVDLALLERWGEVFAPLRPVLTADLGPLLAAGRAYARAQLDADAAFYRTARAPRTAARVSALQQQLAELPPDATLLRLGWGTGKAGKAPFALLLRRPLPRSRRLTHGDDEQPDQPFGWLQCTVRPAPEA
jgi:hypothetical protein